MDINKRIANLLKSKTNVPAVIIYSKNRAVMMMPTKDECENGNHYKIWDNLNSLTDAIFTASEFGSWASKVDFSWQEFSEVPENYEFILCAIFVNNFCQ